MHVPVLVAGICGAKMTRAKGYSCHDWNMTSYVGQATVSGIYLITLDDKTGGEVPVGEFCDHQVSRNVKMACGASGMEKEIRTGLCR